MRNRHTEDWGNPEVAAFGAPPQPDALPVIQDLWRTDITGGNRCEITTHGSDDPWTAWWVPWSPRNGNNNAEGPLSDWVRIGARLVLLEAERREQPVPAWIQALADTEWFDE